MKKIIALVAVCGFAIAFASCGKKAEEAAVATEDSTAAVVETVVDSAAAVVDSAAAVVDSTAAAH